MTKLHISKLSCGFPQMSRIILYEIITVRLGYHKFCTDETWVSFVNAETKDQKKKRCKAIQNKRCRILTSGIVLLHDNVWPHTAAHARPLLGHLNWELFDHPPYSPDPIPSNYHLFTYLKNWLWSQCFNNNEELMEGVKTWLSSQAVDFSDTGIWKLNLWYDKCLNSGGDYAEKYLKYVCISCI
jgi:histone-lysine N-methyltransferase SETMAR